MIKLTTALKSFPYLIASGAIILFTIGYVAHMIIGKENPIEEFAEEMLHQDYNITVEFSGEKN